MPLFIEIAMGVVLGGIVLALLPRILQGVAWLISIALLIGFVVLVIKFLPEILSTAATIAAFIIVPILGLFPVGHFNFLHLWPGQIPPGRTSGL